MLPARHKVCWWTQQTQRAWSCRRWYQHWFDKLFHLESEERISISLHKNFLSENDCCAVSRMVSYLSKPPPPAISCIFCTWRWDQQSCHEVKLANGALTMSVLVRLLQCFSRAFVYNCKKLRKWICQSHVIKLLLLMLLKNKAFFDQSGPVILQELSKLWKDSNTKLITCAQVGPPPPAGAALCK